MGAGVLIGQKKPELKDVIGQYVIFRGSVSTTVTDSSAHSITLDTIAKATSNISNYVGLVNGDILLNPGIYTIGGKIQITSNTENVAIYSFWRKDTDQASLDLSSASSDVDAQMGESYLFIPAGASQAKTIINPTTVEITEPTYVRIGYHLSSANTSMVIAENACRVQITKLK